MVAAPACADSTWSEEPVEERAIRRSSTEGTGLIFYESGTILEPRIAASARSRDARQVR
jgi:hypothetical protein